MWEETTSHCMLRAYVSNVYYMGKAYLPILCLQHCYAFDYRISLTYLCMIQPRTLLWWGWQRKTFFMEEYYKIIWRLWVAWDNVCQVQTIPNQDNLPNTGNMRFFVFWHVWTREEDKTSLKIVAQFWQDLRRLAKYPTHWIFLRHPKVIYSLRTVA